MSDLRRLQDARFSPAMPCTPMPCLLGLTDMVQQRGSSALETDEAKQILWVLMAQSYGQLASIDLCCEYSRLSAAKADRECPDVAMAKQVA